MTTPGFLWARWEWAFSLPSQNANALDRLRVRADGRGGIVALATSEMDLGEAYLVFEPAHRWWECRLP